LNEPDRLEKRAVLIQAACYPSPQAVRMMNQHG
jgi:hypothetical protein